MKSYRSLRWKLAALIAGGSVLTMAMAVAGFVWLDLNRYWEHVNAETAAMAAVVGDQIGPALELGDRKAAREILNSLRSDPLVLEAAVYDAHSVCFAQYRRAGKADCGIRPPDGFGKAVNAVVLARPVKAGGERLGTLVLRVAAPSVIEVVRHYLGGAGLILLLTLAVAAGVAMRLQARVSRPILLVARFAERIARTHRFQDRVAFTSSDELGALADSFNVMLEEIERRDQELGRHRRSLEDEIAERKRVNAELLIAKEKAEEAARMKSQFLANMSHELRTPMNGVIGMISLVLDGHTDPGQRQQLEVAQDAAQALVTILNDILDLSKIEAGKMTLETIVFDLQACLRDAVRVFEIAVRQKGLMLEVVRAPECPTTVRGDPMRLRQILVNLVGNAVKFTPTGSIHVRVGPARAGARDGSELLIEVADTGIGIPASKLSSVFEAFTQADGSHTRRFGGTGLGLAITRRLVDLMGGRLWAASEVGRGSSFFVELPLTAARLEAVSVAPPPLPVLAVPRQRVLVAEDNVINQKVVSAMLTRQGWKVTMAANGAEAVRRFQESPYELLLMDIQMPEMDGMEATRLIRQEEQSRGPGAGHVPILALTADASPLQRAQCRAGGFDGVITKPINRGDFRGAIAAAFGLDRDQQPSAPGGTCEGRCASTALIYQI